MAEATGCALTTSPFSKPSDNEDAAPEADGKDEGPGCANPVCVPKTTNMQQNASILQAIKLPSLVFIKFINQLLVSFYDHGACHVQFRGKMPPIHRPFCRKQCKFLDLFPLPEQAVKMVGLLLIAFHHPGMFHHLFVCRNIDFLRSEEHTSELQSLMRISYAVFCLKKKT